MLGPSPNEPFRAHARLPSALRTFTEHELELTGAEIAARFRWARQQGHIAYLWPHVPVDAWRACLRETERVVGLVLSHHPDPVELVTPPGADARAIGLAAFTSGTGPLLGFWLEQGRLSAEGELPALLRLHLEHNRRRARRMNAELQRALDVLAEAALRAVVVKASHTGPAYFPDAGTRPAADIDLIVPPAEAALAAQRLERAGYRLVKRQRHPWKSDWVPPDSPAGVRSLELTHADNPFTIELHGGALREFFGVRTLSLDPLDERNTRWAPELHGSARVLVQPWLTAYLAAHASEELHQLQLVRIVELALVIRQDTERGLLRGDALLALLRERDAVRFVYPALELVERLVPGTIDEGLRCALNASATPRMRRVLERLGPGTAQRLEGTSLDERFLWTRGPMEMLRRVLHMLWPTRGKSQRLRNVYRERLARVLRGRISLRRYD